MLTSAMQRAAVRQATRAVGILCVLVAALVGAAPPAAAQAQTEAETQRDLKAPNYARGGFYFAAEGLFAVENSSLVGDTVGDDKYLRSGGVQFRFGARHNRWLASEIDIFYIHRWQAATANDPLVWGMMFTERLYMTRGRFQPYLNAGLGFMSLRAPGRRLNTNPSNSPLGTGFAMTFGTGAEIYVTENFAITLLVNYQLTFKTTENPAGDDAGFNFITAGLGFQLF